MKDAQRKLNICNNVMSNTIIGFIVSFSISLGCCLGGCAFEETKTGALVVAGIFAVIFIICLIIAIESFKVGLKCEKQLAFEATCQREIRDIYDEIKENCQKNQKESYVVKDRRGGECHECTRNKQ